jgi:hypothetical protein
MAFAIAIFSRRLQKAKLARKQLLGECSGKAGASSALICPLHSPYTVTSCAQEIPKPGISAFQLWPELKTQMSPEQLKKETGPAVDSGRGAAAWLVTRLTITLRIFADRVKKRFASLPQVSIRRAHRKSQ